MPSQQKLNSLYSVMQAGYWAMFAAFCAYQTALLLSRGFTNGQAGIFMAARCLAGILCQPTLGGFADRHPRVPLKFIVNLSLAASLAANIVFALVPMGMAGTLAVFAVIGGLELSAYPLMDAMAIQYINAGVDIRYSLGRGIGSLAYAIACALLGLQVTRFGVETVLVTHGVLILLEIVLVQLYPAFRPEYEPPRNADRPPERPHSVFRLLTSQPRFTLMLAAAFLGLAAYTPTSGFLFNIVIDRGGTSGDLGIALFLMGAAELPTAFVFNRLMRRFGSGGLMILSMGFILLKLTGLLLAPGFLLVCLCQPLQMMGYGLFTPTSVFYVNENIPAADRVRGQALMMVASNGLGGMAGSLIAGTALDLGGVNVMLIAAMACAVGAAACSALSVKGRAKAR